MSEASRLDEMVEFAENPEPRCPCVLLLDTSSSMRGAPIAALNEGLRAFRDDLIQDALALQRVEVAVVTFDSNVQLVQDFVTVDQFDPPILTAQGYTHMGAAIHQALDMVQARKEQYCTNGVAYYRPWVFMMTDGEPQDEPNDVVEQAAQRLKADEAQKRVAFFAVGLRDAVHHGILQSPDPSSAMSTFQLSLPASHWSQPRGRGACPARSRVRDR